MSTGRNGKIFSEDIFSLIKFGVSTACYTLREKSKKILKKSSFYKGKVFKSRVLDQARSWNIFFFFFNSLNFQQPHGSSGSSFHQEIFFSSRSEDKRRGGLVVSGISLLVVSAGPWVRNANKPLGQLKTWFSLAYPDAHTHSRSCMPTDKHADRALCSTLSLSFFL